MRRFSDDFLERNDTAQSCLYVPAHRVSKWWDLILHLPLSNRVVFLQVSKSDLRTHDYRAPTKKDGPPTYRIKKSLDGGADSWVAQKVKAITGKTGIFAIDSSSGDISLPRDGNLNVYLIFVTAQAKDDVQSDAPTKSRLSYKGLHIMSKELCKTSLGIDC